MTAAINNLISSHRVAKAARNAVKVHEREQRALRAVHNAKHDLYEMDRSWRVTKAAARDKRIELLRLIQLAEADHKSAKADVDDLLKDDEL